MLVARAVLRFRDGYLNPGDPVPLEEGRDYRPWIEAGLIEEVPDSVEEPAPPVFEQDAASEQESPSEEKPFVCEECQETFRSEHGLKVHVTRRHWRP